MESGWRRAEPKIADHLFPETGFGGRARRTLAVVPEPNVRISASTATAVVQLNFMPSVIAERVGRGPPSDTAAVHVCRSISVRRLWSGCVRSVRFSQAKRQKSTIESHSRSTVLHGEQ